ncbi:MAG: ABC transporter ATP-binding protein [Chloroflexi bacterium]|nr:ABC transporter ATP-binding protein [Chloroflexota bacterium]
MEKREFTVADEYLYDRSGPGRWIVSHLLRYPLFPLAAFLATVLNNWFYSSIQVVVGRGFDVITTPGWHTATLLGLALTVVGFGLGQGLTGLMRNFSMEFLAQHIERDSRQELYISLLGKSQTFHGRQRIGDIMARATNDVHMLNLMFSPGVMLIMDSVMAAIVPLVLIGRLEARLLPVPLAFLAVLVVTVVDYNRRLEPVSIALRDQFGQMNATLAEAVAGIEVVKANVQERQEWARFARDARLYRDSFVRQGEIQARYLPLLAFSVAWAAALLHSLWLWRAGGLSLGQVVAFMGLMGVLRFPTFISLFSFNLVQIGIASAERILQLINTETELDENKAGVSRPIRGEVVFDNVSFSYDDNPRSRGTEYQPVLRDINFSAQPGETIAIVGQTGSGKTTLTRLINRIFDVDSGRVLVDGVDVRDWSLESLRSQISTIEQDIFLFSHSVRDNIAFACKDADQEAIEHAAREAQAHEFIAILPNGYSSEIGERGENLSGGQRQRIAIARALLTDPRILILDDSTSAIDSATEDQIQRAMRHIPVVSGANGSSKRTTFLITHRLSQIRWANRILVLRQGELVDQGTHEELMERCEAYRRIFARYE